MPIDLFADESPQAETGSAPVDLFSGYTDQGEPTWDPSLGERAMLHARKGFQEIAAGKLANMIRSNPVLQHEAFSSDLALDIADRAGLDRTPTRSEAGIYLARHPEFAKAHGFNPNMPVAASLPFFPASEEDAPPLSVLKEYAASKREAAAEAREEVQQDIQQMEHRYQTMEPAEGLVENMVAVGAHILGNSLTPLTFVGGPAASAGRGLLRRGAGYIARDFGLNAAIGAGQNTAVQLAETGEIDLEQVALVGAASGAGGAALGGAIRGASAAMRGATAAVEERAARRAAQAAERATPEEVKQARGLAAALRKAENPRDVQAVTDSFVESRMTAPVEDSEMIGVHRRRGEQPTREQVRADRKRRQKELNEAFEQSDQPVTRRDQVDEEGNTVEQAQFSEDFAGSPLNREQLAAYQAVRQAAEDNKISLTDRQIRLAADDLQRSGWAQRAARYNEQPRGRRGPPPREEAEEVARVYSKAGRKSAFAVANARRAEKETRLAGDREGGTRPGADYRAGGREFGAEPTEPVYILDAGRTADGRLSPDARVVEPTNEWAVQDTPDGPVAYQKYTTTGEKGEPVELWAQPQRVTEFRRPTNPRMAQEFHAASQELPRGYDTTGTGPRRATDRISSRSIMEPRPARGVEGPVEPSPDITQQPPPAPPRAAQGVDGEVVGREVDEPPVMVEAIPEGAPQERATTPDNMRRATDLPAGARLVTPEQAREVAGTTEQNLTADEKAVVDKLSGLRRKIDEAVASGDDARTQQAKADYRGALVEYQRESAKRVQTHETPGGTLYSGIPVVEVARWVTRSLGRALAGSAEDRSKWASEVQGLSEALVDAAGKPRAALKKKSGQHNVLRRWGRALIYDTDLELRGIAKGINSPTLKNLADALHPLAGEDKGVNWTYQEAFSTRLNQRSHDVQDILDFIRSNKLDEKQIVRLVKRPDSPRQGKTGEAVRMVEKFFKEELDYLHDAGIFVKEIKRGYFPLAFDQGKVHANAADFVGTPSRPGKAWQAYMTDGMPKEQAGEAASRLYDSIVHGDAKPPGAGNDYGSLPSFSRGRVFSDRATKILQDYRVEDLDYALFSYARRATHRAEIANAKVRFGDGREVRFGDRFENWHEIEQQIRAEDDNAVEVMDRVRDLVAAATNTNTTNVSSGVETAMSRLRTLTALSLLNSSTLPSIADLFVAPSRAATTSATRAWANQFTSLVRTFGDASRKIARLGPSERLQHWADLAEDLGVVASLDNQQIMQARYAIMDPSSRLERTVQEAFFRRTMMTQLTHYSRVRALGMGQVFLRRLAKQMARGGRSQRTASAALRELGVPRGKETAFAEQLAQFDHLPTMADLGHGEFASHYNLALRRFTDQSSMHPNASTRPAWANHPVGSIFFNLMSFSYAFGTNVAARPIRFFRSDDTTMIDKALMASAWGTSLPTLMGVSYLVGEMRDAMFRSGPNDRELSPEAKVERAFRMAGFTGRWDYVVNALMAAKYGGSLADVATGPSIGMILELGDSTLSLITSTSSTNTAERNLYDQLGKMFVEPALQTALAFMPTGGLLGAGATGASIYAVPKAREYLTDLFGGPARPNPKADEPIPGLADVISKGQLFSGFSESGEDGFSWGGSGGSDFSWDGS